MATKTVDYFEVEVKYSGSINDYSIQDLFDMALAKQASRGDFEPEFTAMIPADHAEAIDGQVEVENRYPCNHLAIVRWSCIREEA